VAARDKANKVKTGIEIAGKVATVVASVVGIIGG
jgi:hypothetical protein